MSTIQQDRARRRRLEWIAGVGVAGLLIACGFSLFSYWGAREFDRKNRSLYDLGVWPRDPSLRNPRLSPDWRAYPKDPPPFMGPGDHRAMGKDYPIP